MVRNLHYLATTYHKAPSSYYGLEGVQALLFDMAIAWGAERMPKEEEAPKGIVVRG